MGRRQHSSSRFGEARRGSAGSGNQGTRRSSPPGPGRSSGRPAVVRGRSGKEGKPRANDEQPGEVRPVHSSCEACEQRAATPGGAGGANGWGRGKFRVGCKPSRKRMGRALRRIREELRKRMHWSRRETVRWLGRVIDGWLNHYAVPGTSRALKAFVLAVRRMLLSTLRRCSRKDRYKWSALDRLIGFHWSKPTIRHPWPAQRLTVNTQGRSRMR